MNHPAETERPGSAVTLAGPVVTSKPVRGMSMNGQENSMPTDAGATDDLCERLEVIASKLGNVCSILFLLRVDIETTFDRPVKRGKTVSLAFSRQHIDALMWASATAEDQVASIYEMACAAQDAAEDAQQGKGGAS